MQCPKCQSENREGVKFCEDCGARMEIKCPSCNASIPMGKRFCGECGLALTEPQDVPTINYSEPQSYTPRHLKDKILTTRSSIEGERKLVTVFFADVTNYTAMSEKLDPEEVHQIMDGCFKILMDEIHKYEGTINQFTGDGVMALFGAPVAHEDHAQRACYAALSVQKAMGEYEEKIKKDTGVDFKMRIGLNSGPVIVGSIGDDLRMDYTAVGDTTNLAARIQQSARPCEVWLSQDTQSIIRGFFQVESVGDLELKGKVKPQPTYRLVAEYKEVRTRFEAGLAKGVTELVGRRPEMEILKTAWERVRSDEARVVDVVGEAGVGKSRLAYEFQNTITDEATILTGICIHYGRNINFLPLIDIIRAAFGIEEGMSEEEAGRCIEEKAVGELESMIPFYRNLLSLRVDDEGFNSLNPEGRKFGTFEAMKNLLLSLSEDRPLVIFLEDVHWIDKISEEFFVFFSHSIHGKRILMLTAYRPESAPEWAKGPHYRHLGLETLSEKSSGRLVRNILGGVELDPDLEKEILAKTGGNPFFVEEMVRELLERDELIREGDRYTSRIPIEHLDIPGTVQGVLAARMDRLSEDLKQTMQVASVIGRDFAYKILRIIMELGDDLRTHLTNLVGIEVLYEKALYPEMEYIFKNALTQEVAYESLLKQRRREIHGRIACAIEELYASRLNEHYELLAHHYERSGDVAKEVQYLILAGEKANQNNAVQAASEFFKKALEASENSSISLDPETEVRVRQGLAESSYGLGDIDTALEEYKKVVATTRKHNMVDHEMGNLSELAMVMWMSPITIMKDQAIRFFEEGIARAREVGDKSAESRILSVKGLYRCALGHRYHGNQIIADAEQLALKSEDMETIAYNRIVHSISERWLGRPQKAIELTEGMTEAMRDMVNLNSLSGLIFIRGIALSEFGRIEEGIALLRTGVDICEKYGFMTNLVRLYNSLGYCYGEVHNPDKAWQFNLKSEESARKLMEQYPMGRETSAEVVAQANVNLMENLFDQGNPDAAWDRMKSFKEETKSDDYIRARDRWEVRMDYLTSQILLLRNDVDQAKSLIQKNLEIIRREHSRKMEGGFLRLLGNIQFRRNESDNAIATLKEAIHLLKEVGNPRHLWQTHATLASTFDKLGRLSEKREQWQAAMAVVESTADELKDEGLKTTFINAAPIREIIERASR